MRKPDQQPASENTPPANPSAEDKPIQPTEAALPTPTRPKEIQAEPTASATLPLGLVAIRLQVENRFLTALGETEQLSVSLLDAQGKVLNSEGVKIEWSSSRAGDLAVDQTGKVTALVGLGK